jgi:hypothetical protein
MPLPKKPKPLQPLKGTTPLPMDERIRKALNKIINEAESSGPANASETPKRRS